MEKNEMRDLMIRRGDAAVVGAFAAMVVPSALFAYDGRWILAGAAASFVTFYLISRALGLLCAAVRAARRVRVLPEPEYVSRRLDNDRRLGYISAEAVCRAAREGRREA